jgi:glycerophosphoryl diester phosphodiesterase
MNRDHIFAHRGLWRSKNEQNSKDSFLRAFESGFSVETDLRQDSGRIVVSHNSVDFDVMNADELLDFDGRFALNLKSDGLIEYAVRTRKWLSETQSFYFDSSVPEQYKFLQNDIPTADRLSEFEKTLNFDSKWVWVDSFKSDWWDRDSQIHNLLGDNSKLLIFVSPELHGRNHENAWLRFGQLSREGFMFGICTDHPEALSTTLGI